MQCSGHTPPPQLPSCEAFSTTQSTSSLCCRSQHQRCRTCTFPPLTWRVSIYRKESQALENNFREILFLIEQINVLKALLRETQDGLHNDSRNADGDSSEAQNATEITDEVQWGWGTGRGEGLLLVPPPSRPLTGRGCVLLSSPP